MNRTVPLPGGADEFVTAERFGLDEEAAAPRTDLLLSAWLDRDLPPRDYLLGNVLCTTSRWLVYGETGVGKTLFGADMAGAIAAGRSFLNWEGRRPARVMYLDGELPAETFKERMQLIGDQYGRDLALFGYSREVLGPDEMAPLNTPQGEAWLWREIERTQPDVIFFDSIMCLLAGSMAEEESWAPVKLLIRRISTRRIAQVWFHHTGHDATKGYGTKTREWELDTVVALTATEDGQGVRMEFKKARLRRPQTADEFKPRTLQCGEDGWSSEDADPKAASSRKSTETEAIRKAFVAAYDRLADGAARTPGLDGSPVLKVAVDRVRDELKSRGFLDANDAGHLTATARSHFRRVKTELIDSSMLIETDGLIWRM